MEQDQRTVDKVWDEDLADAASGAVRRDRMMQDSDLMAAGGGG